MNAALPPSTDSRTQPDQLRLRQIELARQAVMQEGRSMTDVAVDAWFERAWIERSWRRCLAAGRRPDQRLAFDMVPEAARSASLGAMEASPAAHTAHATAALGESTTRDTRHAAEADPRRRMPVRGGTAPGLWQSAADSSFVAGQERARAKTGLPSVARSSTSAGVMARRNRARSPTKTSTPTTGANV